MKKAIKIILLVLLFLAVALGAVFGYRWYSGRQASAAPVAVEGQTYLTTTPAGEETAIGEVDENDDLSADSNIEPVTAWPFADAKADSKFEAKESVGYTAKQASQKTTAKAKKTKDASEEKTKEADAETTKKTSKESKAASGSAKGLLEKIQNSASSTKNGHPVKVDSNGISIEYKKFAVADLNGDGKDEVFLYAESTKGKEFYGNSYIVYDNTLKNVRTTMVVDEFKDVTFYKSGVFEIVKNKFGFTSDAIAASFGVKNENSILGYDTNATPYLKYTTNGPYIAEPSEVSSSEYNAAVKKLKAGGKAEVKIYDFTAANVAKL